MTIIEDMYGMDDDNEINIEIPKEKNDIKHGNKTIKMNIDGKDVMIPSMKYIKDLERENELLLNQIKKLNFKLGNQVIHIKNIMREISNLKREINEKVDNYD